MDLSHRKEQHDSVSVGIIVHLDALQLCLEEKKLDSSFMFMQIRPSDPRQQRAKLRKNQTPRQQLKTPLK